MRETIAVLTDRRMTRHDGGAGHPECPDRLRALLAMIDGRNDPDLRLVPAEPVSRELTRLVHDPVYVESHLERLDGGTAQLDADTAVSPGSWEAARLAAGCAAGAVDCALSDAPRRALALVRPPGHHAERDRAMGFCLLNNVALAAEHALSCGCRRVLVIDWDVHHGNGTQHLFEDRSDVLFFSAHQHPLYPGTGRLSERGRGDGEGFTVNAPLPAGCGDAEYATLFRELLVPLARDFEPDLLIVSAGFDAHADDPLAGMRVTTEGFAVLAGMVTKLADDLCGGRIALCLEGGYALDALASSVSRMIDVLEGDTPAAAFGEPAAAGRAAIDEALRLHLR